MVKKAIRHYLDNHIILSKNDISAAAKSREWLLKRIENVINNRSCEPKLYPSSTENFVYFGSYFKGTKVSNVDEYDVLVVIDSNFGFFSREGAQIGTGQGNINPNPKYDRKYFKEDNSGVSPSKMLNWLKSVVDEVVESYNGEAPIRDHQAITATIKSQDLKIDLVPAGIFKDGQGKIFYNIPDGSSKNSWITTSPRLDIDKINELSKDRNDFKNIIRIIKKVRSTRRLQINSFPIEMALINYVHKNVWHNDLFVDTVLSIRHFAELLNKGVIEDIFNLNQNLLLEVDNLETYARRLNGIADQLVVWNSGNYTQEEVTEKVVACFENNL